MRDEEAIAPPILWKDMEKPMTLEEYTAQRIKAYIETPANLAALAEPPMEIFYAQFDPGRLQDRFRGANHRYTPQAWAAVENNMAKVAPPGARKEIVSFLVPDESGQMTLAQPPSESFVTRDRRGNIVSYKAKTTRPPGARFGIHNHPTDSLGFADHTPSGDGYGDSMSLSSPDPYPMATVARPRSGPLKGQDVIGVHEMVNGQLIFRVPYGAIIDDEERALIQQNLNRAQRNFYRE